MSNAPIGLVQYLPRAQQHGGTCWPLRLRFLLRQGLTSTPEPGGEDRWTSFRQMDVDMSSMPRFLAGLFALVFPPTWHVLPPPRCPARSCSLYSVLREVCRMGFREVVVHGGYRVPKVTRRNGGDAGDQNAANDSGCSCGFLEERATSPGQDAFGPDAASPHASWNLAPAQAWHSLLCFRPLNERGSHGAACVLGAGPASARPGVAGS